MDLALHVALLLALLAAGLGPGLVLVGRLRLSPLERLTAGVALSFFILYFVAFALFWAKAPAAVYFVASGGGAACLARARDQLGLFARDPMLRRTLACLACLVAWSFLLLGLVRYFGGAGTGGDWLEHAQRTAFFSRQLPPGQPLDYHFQFIGLYDLPARPPLQNLVAAFFCRQVGQNFEYFSLIFLLLNSLVFLPAALLLAVFQRRGRTRLTLLALLFALNPCYVQNVTLTWTKAFSAFYVLVAIWFYLRALRKPGGLALVPAAAAFAAGILVHYSAAPFALAVGLHYALTTLWQRRPPGAAFAGLLGALLLMPWFAWSIGTYGIAKTLASNTAVAESAHLGLAANLWKMLLNHYYTVVPPGMRGESIEWFASASFASLLRDTAFLAYQMSFPIMIGSAGGVLAAWLTLRALTGGPGRADEKRFWIVFLPASVVIGICSHGTLEPYGVGHIVLQPVVYMALAMLAVGLPTLGAGLRVAAVAGCAVDLALGICLHFALESHVFRLIQLPNGHLDALLDNGLSPFAARNYLVKQALGIVFWGDHLAPLVPGLQILVLCLGTGMLVALARQLRLSGLRPGR